MNERTGSRCRRMAVLPLPLLALALFACGPEAERPARRPPAVRVAPVAESDGARILRLNGTLEPERSMSAGFAVPGTVEKVFVNVGDVVKKGQPLASLAKGSYADALGIARAKANQAEDTHQRLAPMHANKTLPEVKMVEVATGVEEARRAVSLAQANLADTVLRAPESGVIARRNAEPGATAIPGVPMFTVVQTSTIHATARVPEKHIGRVKVGDGAKVAVPALGITLDGRVQELGVIADPLTRTYAVKVALANDGDLRLGMVAEVRLGVDTGARDLAVPQEAVRIDEAGRPFVYVVADGRISRRPVEVAGFAGEAVALTSGVAAGEQVVISGTAMLGDGMAVRVLDAAVAAGGSQP